jgi:predicted XRE-type DNA-binding protein
MMPRIRKAAALARDATDAAELMRRQRDELILQAVDAGISQRQIARAAGIAKSRVVAIVGNTTVRDVI